MERRPHTPHDAVVSVPRRVPSRRLVSKVTPGPGSTSMALPKPSSPGRPQ